MTPCVRNTVFLLCFAFSLSFSRTIQKMGPNSVEPVLTITFQHHRVNSNVDDLLKSIFKRSTAPNLSIQSIEEDINDTNLLSNMTESFSKIEDYSLQEKRQEHKSASSMVSSLTAFEDLPRGCSFMEVDNKTLITCNRPLTQTASSSEDATASNDNETELYRAALQLVSKHYDAYLRACRLTGGRGCQNCSKVEENAFLHIDTRKLKHNTTMAFYYQNFLKILCRNYTRKLQLVLRKDHIDEENNLSLSVGQWLRVAAYVVIFFSGVIGNSLVVVTLIYHRNMRSITNIFLLNLAISDLLLGVVCMPFTLVGSLLQNFIFGATMCKFIPYIQAVSVSVSVWTLVAISMERFYAICEPLSSRQWQTFNHAYKVVACVWSGSILAMVPIAILSELVEFKNSKGLEKHKCREKWPNVEAERGFSLLLSFSLLLLPLIIMGVAYFRIVRHLSRGMKIEKQQVYAISHSTNEMELPPMCVAKSRSLKFSVKFRKFPSRKVSGSDPFSQKDANQKVFRKKQTPLMPGMELKEGNIEHLRHLEGKDIEAELEDVVTDGENDETKDAEIRSVSRSFKNKYFFFRKQPQASSGVNAKAQNGYRINSSETFQPIRSTHLRQSLVAKQRVVRMLFVLVAEFFICWTPLFLVNLFALWLPKMVYGALGNVGISLIQLLAYASSCCNPITYCFMNATFLQSFKQAFGLGKKNREMSKSFISHGYQSSNLVQRKSSPGALSSSVAQTQF